MNVSSRSEYVNGSCLKTVSLLYVKARVRWYFKAAHQAAPRNTASTQGPIILGHRSYRMIGNKATGRRINARNTTI